MQIAKSNKALKSNKVFVFQNYSSFFLVCIFLILSLNSYAERRACERSAKAIKILYGVQGTGNGHLTRARELGQSLKAAGVQVDFVFSGRNRETLSMRTMILYLVPKPNTLKDLLLPLRMERLITFKPF